MDLDRTAGPETDWNLIGCRISGVEFRWRASTYADYVAVQTAMYIYVGVRATDPRPRCLQVTEIPQKSIYRRVCHAPQASTN